MTEVLKGLAVFTNAELHSRALALQAKWVSGNVDGHALFSDMRNLLIRQGEINFEEEVADFPYGMEISHEVFHGDEFKEWLSDNCDPSDYILSPKNAQGIYKEKWNWIYFKDSKQAVLFKLACL